MTYDLAFYVSGALSGALVGFILALVGGGGSILATPLIVYLVGVREPHIAIGTSALAVGLNAMFGVYGHARRGNVAWRPAVWFAGAGVFGALLGSMLGKAFDGQRLLFLFAILMIVVGALMLRRRTATDEAGDGRIAPARTSFYGLMTGAFSGFFGIGGGFLIVPGLTAATGMAMIRAIGTSLVAVAVFGLTTAASYAWSGLIDWTLAAVFVTGGLLGSLSGTALSHRLSRTDGLLRRIFAGLIFVVAAYMLWQSGTYIFA